MRHVTMQRRHFELIADTLASQRPPDPEQAEFRRWYSIVRAMADTLARTNGAFDRDRFITACGAAP